VLLEGSIIISTLLIEINDNWLWIDIDNSGRVKNSTAAGKGD
jgi:hypothetical protein